MYTSIFKIILNRRLNIKIKSFMVLAKKIGFNIHSEKLVYSIYFIYISIQRIKGNFFGIIFFEVIN